MTFPPRGKWCSHCGKEETMFSFDKRYDQKVCLECSIRLRGMQWRKKNKNKRLVEESADVPSQGTLCKHGISKNDYRDMVAGQGGECAICGYVPISGEKLHIDHNHDTSEVRGLLCPHCNWAIGHLKDSPQNCRNAAKYLEEYGG